MGTVSGGGTAKIAAETALGTPPSAGHAIPNNVLQTVGIVLVLTECNGPVRCHRHSPQ
jgi:hypothetical protein